METNTKIQYGAIGLLALIVAALGGTIYLTPDQLDNAYICSMNQNVVIAERLSSTFKTAYWTENNVTQSQTCRNGLWINLKQYAEENNIEISVLLQNINSEVSDENPVSSAQPGKSYSCDQTKCVLIQ